MMLAPLRRLRHLAAGGALVAALAGCASREPWAIAEGQHPQHVHRRVTSTVDADFLLYLPPGFTMHPPTRYPLLIFLHGSGESGRNVQAVAANGPPRLAAEGARLPFIVASPQALDERQGFDPSALNGLLDELLERLPIDPQRVYLTGLSMGGEWTYAWASMNPERFAAIAPVCGAWTPDMSCRLKRVPVWAFHGAKDDVVPVADDRAMIDAINRCGGDARMTEYPDVGHDVWSVAYANDELYRWLLAHRRDGTH